MHGSPDGPEGDKPPQDFRVAEHARWAAGEGEGEHGSASEPVGETRGTVEAGAPEPEDAPRRGRQLLVVVVAVLFVGVGGFAVWQQPNFFGLEGPPCEDEDLFDVERARAACGREVFCFVGPEGEAAGATTSCTVQTDGRFDVAFRLVGGGSALVQLFGPDGESFYYARHPGDVAPAADPYELVQRGFRGEPGTWRLVVRWDELPDDASRIILWD